MTLLVVVLAVWALGLLPGLVMRDGGVFFGWGIGGGFGLAVVYLIVASVLQGVLGYHELYRDYPIVALSDERTSTGGTFFLGSGSIGTSAAFEFYVDEGGGARELFQIPSDGVRVYEDVTAGQEPYAVWHEGRTNNHNAVSWCIHGCDITALTELHVPPHSIKQGIVLGVKQP